MTNTRLSKPKTEKSRTYFPETWLWNLIYIGYENFQRFVACLKLGKLFVAVEKCCCPSVIHVCFELYILHCLRFFYSTRYPKWILKRNAFFFIYGRFPKSFSLSVSSFSLYVKENRNEILGHYKNRSV